MIYSLPKKLRKELYPEFISVLFNWQLYWTILCQVWFLVSKLRRDKKKTYGRLFFKFPPFQISYIIIGIFAQWLIYVVDLYRKVFCNDLMSFLLSNIYISRFRIFKNFLYQGGVKSTVFLVFEDLKFKISDGYDQNWCFPDSAQLAVSV